MLIEESEREDNSRKANEAKQNTWRTRKIIHMEFDSDDDMDEQTKNSRNLKTEGKVQVKKKFIHYYEYSSDEAEGKRADLKKAQKTQKGHENQDKMMKMTDRKRREHQLYPQMQAGCYLQTQRWFHGSTDMGSKDCTKP